MPRVKSELFSFTLTSSSTSSSTRTAPAATKTSPTTMTATSQFDDRHKNVKKSSRQRRTTRSHNPGKCQYTSKIFWLKFYLAFYNFETFLAPTSQVDSHLPGVETPVEFQLELQALVRFRQTTIVR